MNTLKSIKHDAIYMIVPYGIGDAMILCGLKKYIEDSYGAEVVPVLKPSQEIVARLYGITKYRLETFDNEKLKQLANTVHKPTPGKYFVAHPAYGNKMLNLRFLNHEISFTDMFCEFFGINRGLRIAYPPEFPKAASDLKRRVGCSDFKDIILFAPEMKSASESERIQDNIFLELIREYENKGYKVIVNCDIHREFYVDYFLDMSLEELAYIGMRAGKVISSRSGFCDLMYGFVEDMDILYPNQAFYDLFGMKRIFLSENLSVSEKVFPLAHELRKKGFSNAAIYGYGNVGRRVRYSLAVENFDVMYVIDRCEILERDVERYDISQQLPEVDVVIISIADDGDIKKTLRKRGFNALFLKEVMRGNN